MKRVISFLLALSLLFTAIPVAAFAAEKETNATVGPGNVSIKGTNSFGTLLGEDIEEEIESNEKDAEGYSAGYTVVGLTIDGNIATVEYTSLENALVVVSLYTEDGKQLLISGTAAAYADATEVTVTLEGDLPEYFMASAYLLDNYDYSPLCPAYDTPMYTQEMQELLSSTVEDYEEDRVLNLDDDPTTNFAVYADGTIVVEYIAGVNTVVSADDENARYVIKNIDEQIAGLQAGQIFVYAYAENAILIVKVDTITVAGTTATIIGTEVEMEEVFSHIKIEGAGDTSDIEVDETTGDKDVTFLGLIEEAEPFSRAASAYSIAPAAEEGDASAWFTLGFSFERDVWSSAEELMSFKVKGSLNAKLKAKFSYYISLKRQFVELKVNLDSSVAVSFEGETVRVAFEFPSMGISPVPGVYIGFEPELQLKATVEVKLSCSAKNTYGFSYDNKDGFQNLATAPQVTTDGSFEGKVFLGIDLAPHVNVLQGAVTKLKLSSLGGVELTAEENGSCLEDVPVIGTGKVKDTIHTCEHCLKIEVECVAKLTVSVEFLKSDWLTVKWNVAEYREQLCDFYYSSDHSKFGRGSCPYKSYRVVVVAQADDSGYAPSTEVFYRATGAAEATSMGFTSGGLVAGYFPAGEYTFTGVVDGTERGTTLQLTEPTKVILGKTGEDFSFIDGAVLPENLETFGVVDSGTCGADGDNIIWTLYGNGHLVLEGAGSMEDYSYDNYAPWQSLSHLVKRVTISDGITTIGDWAFFECVDLTSVTIPDSVTAIGNNAFESCFDLTSVVIGDRVTTIGECAFYDCDCLESVTIGDSVTAIGDGAFWGCDSLTLVIIPDSVTSIGQQAFSSCDNLTEIQVGTENPVYSSENGVLFNKEKTVLIQCPGGKSGNYSIPDSITTIGAWAFYSCYDLMSVVIGNGVTTIGAWAFADCGLESVIIPDSVTSIGDYAFEDCSCLESVTIGNGVTTIGECAFYDCDNLISVIIPDSVTSIDERAFGSCYYLESVTIGNGVTSIGRSAFEYCFYLTSVVIGDSVTSIGDYAFVDCRLESVTIPNSVTSIGNHAFEYCYYLTSVVIGDNVTTIGEYAFKNCDLTSVRIPDSVTSIGQQAFSRCDNLTEIQVGTENSTYSSEKGVLFNKDKTVLIQYPAGRLGRYSVPDGITAINDYAFYACYDLTAVTIPDSVASIGYYAFFSCCNLDSITFEGNAPNIDPYAFEAVSATVGATVATTVYYPTGNDTWTEDMLQGYGGSLTWVPYSLDNNGELVTGETAVVAAAMSDEESAQSKNGTTDVGESTEEDCSISFASIFDGEYENEKVDEQTLWTATFTNLVPGREYVLLALATLDAEELLAADNLLFIDQAPAAEDGTLVFRYILREDAEFAYVMACGASHKDLADAQVTFPCMNVSENRLEVKPTVIYEGEVLQEGKDYILAGDVDYAAEGEYTFYVRGIRGYTGLLAYNYSVLPEGKHKETILPAVEPTCTETGLTAGKKCVCGAILEAQETVPVKEHNMGAWTAISGTSPLQEQQKCTDCIHKVIRTLNSIAVTTEPDKLNYLEGESFNAAGMVITAYYDNGTNAPVTGYTVSGYNSTPGTKTITVSYGGRTAVFNVTVEAKPVEDEEDIVDGVFRIYGSNRFDTAFGAANMLKETLGVEKFENIIVACGTNFADALAGSYLGKVKNAPILLVQPNMVPAVRAYIEDNLQPGGTVYLLGGETIVPGGVSEGLTQFTTKRLWGANRYETNLAILEEAGVTGGEILVCTGYGFADSLSASAVGKPILLVDKKLTAGQEAYLASLTDDSYVIVGGIGAVNEVVEESLRGYGAIERLAGANRFATSVMVAERFFENPTNAVVAYAANFPDGLCGGPLAMSMGGPLLLTANNDAAITAAYTEANSICDGVVLGGPGLISDNAVRQIFGMEANDNITVK